MSNEEDEFESLRPKGLFATPTPRDKETTLNVDEDLPLEQDAEVDDETTTPSTSEPISTWPKPPPSKTAETKPMGPRSWARLSDGPSEGGKEEDVEEFVPPSDARDGNYILTVGKPGCGKTTLQSHLLRYLFKSMDHVAMPDKTHALTNKMFDEFIEEWNEQWEENRFPKSTPVGRPVWFRYEVKPRLFRHLPALNFGFVEMSGEDFRFLTDRSVEAPAVMKSIDGYLQNRDCKLTFLFVCQGHDLRGDDFLFSRFLDYLDRRVDRNLQKVSSAALVITNPERGADLLARELKMRPIDGKLDVAAFIKHFAPQTAAALEAMWGQKAAFTPFSVGKVARPQGAPAYIEEPSFDDARTLYNWLYKSFTGRELGPDFLTRAITYLERLGGGKS